MACCAVERGMHSGESKTSELQMIKLRAKPAIDRVALCTLQGGMEASKGPTGGRVIESSRSPVCGAVAHFALLREARCDVIRIVGSLEIFKMATDARRDRDVVIPIDVALSALHLGVGSSERERGL